MIKNRPKWCPHQECIYKYDSQSDMCVGLLPNKEIHDNDYNTHRLCINTEETGHGIFDLQINWTDAWNLIRLLNMIKLDK